MDRFQVLHSSIHLDLGHRLPYLSSAQVHRQARRRDTELDSFPKQTINRLATSLGEKPNAEGLYITFLTLRREYDAAAESNPVRDLTSDGWLTNILHWEILSDEYFVKTNILSALPF